MDSLEINGKVLDPSSYQHSYFKDEQKNSHLYILLNTPLDVDPGTQVTVKISGVSWGTPKDAKDYTVGLFGAKEGAVDPEKAPFELSVYKYGTNEKGEVDFSSEPIEGAEFRLYKYQYVDEGKELYTEPRTLTAGEGNALTLKDVEPGMYALTESKSPEGYELLPEAFIFEVVDTGSAYAMKPAREYSFIQWGVTDGTHGEVRIADIRRTGSLPNTGGMGVFAPMCAGLAVIALAVVLGRRRSRGV
nr:SpaA isopeptide-forming pilin-related protein [Corynebacterium uropygiale]